MPERPPNLLFILHDQQRYDCLEPAGMQPVRTPNIARLAAAGVWCERAYTPIPVCAPARQALFTGRRPESFGALWNPRICFPVKMIPPDAYCWTRSVRAQGYNTAYIGTWDVDDQRQPEHYGFDSYLGRAEINREIRERHPGVVYKNGYFGESSPIPLEDAYTHLVARHAIARLEALRAARRPWYLHIDNPDPHLPCRPSAPFDKLYDPDSVPRWGSFDETFAGKPYIQRQQLVNWELEQRDWQEWKRTVACYYGIISQYDDAIGRILDHLEATGEIDNTIIVYTSDHGDMCGGHRLIDKHYNMYEDICRVPLVIRWDGHIKPGRFESFAHNCLDLPPTLLSLLGIEPPAGCMQGTDISACLLDGRRGDGRAHVVATYNGQQFGLYCARMIRDARHKYVWNLTDVDELYDLTADPHELTNLIYAADKREVVRELRLKLHAELKRCADPIIGWTANQLLQGRKL